jgi:hypothetical protein
MGATLVFHPSFTIKHEESDMPKVGSKHYAYTKKGQDKAKAAAKASGKKISYKKPKK